MSTNFGAKAKDLMRCLKNIHKFADGQASLLHWDEDNLDELTILLAPNSGPYEGGRFEFKIRLGDDYPAKPPIVTCLTNILHPNINILCGEEHNICFSLFHDWRKGKFGLEDVINGLLFLLNYPNVADPWSEFFDPSTSERTLLRAIRKTLAGMGFEGIEFPKFVEYDAAKYDFDDSDADEDEEDFWQLPDEDGEDKSQGEKQVLCVEDTVSKISVIIDKLPQEDEESETNDGDDGTETGDEEAQVQEADVPTTTPANTEAEQNNSPVHDRPSVNAMNQQPVTESDHTAGTRQEGDGAALVGDSAALVGDSAALVGDSAATAEPDTNTGAGPVPLSRSDTQPASDIDHPSVNMRRTLSLNPTRTGANKVCMDLKTLYTVSGARCLTGAVAMSRQDTLTCLSVQNSVRGDKRGISQLSETPSPDAKRQQLNGE